MLALFVFAMFFWLFITALADLWTDPEASGWSKALWTFFIVILPWLGILIYLIARGGGMAERAVTKQVAQEQRYREIMASAGPDVGGGGSAASELEALAKLKASGDLTQEEFDMAKAKLLA